MEDYQLIEELEGRPISYVSNAGMKMLSEIARSVEFVPATTRTIEQFRRINFGKFDIPYKYAITSNGGNILIDGKEDQDWNQSIRSHIKENCEELKNVNEKMLEIDKAHGVIREPRSAEDLFLYYIVDQEKISEEILKEISEFSSKLNWKCDLQGRKLYLIPDCINKGRAVQHVMEVLGKKELIASGDAVLDLPLLHMAMHPIVPKHGGIAEQMAHKAMITEEEGLRALEDMLTKVMAIISK